MQITNVKIVKTFDDSQKLLKAIASVTIDDSLIIHDIRLLKTDDKMFIAMPNKKLSEGEYKDIIHPINKEGRELFTTAVIAEYEEYIETIND